AAAVARRRRLAARPHDRAVRVARLLPAARLARALRATRARSELSCRRVRGRAERRAAPGGRAPGERAGSARSTTRAPRARRSDGPPCALPSRAMRPRVFIDGSVGTTGLRIRELLAARSGHEVATLSEAARKDSAARRDALRAAAFAILCLPDDAAREAATWAADAAPRVIDASTAHRVAEGWVYG